MSRMTAILPGFLLLAGGLYAEPAVESNRFSKLGSDVEKTEFAGSVQDVAGRTLSFRLEQTYLTDELSSAEGNSTEKDGAGWDFTFTLYTWMAGVKTDAIVGPFELSGEADFMDLVKKLDIGLMLHFEGCQERWGFMLDGLYMNLSDNAKVRVANVKLRGVDIDGELELVLLEAGAFYRFGEAGSSFDALVGVRYLSIDVQVDPGPLRTRSTGADWVDPFIGGRFQLGLSERWSLSLRGDVGGFDVGSQLTWNVTALLGYRLSEKTTLAFGYRHLDIDYDSGNFSLDAQFSGPYLGLSYRF